jgi:tripartite-type tricarboxylate transporter receptor subunit TctC
MHTSTQRKLLPAFAAVLASLALAGCGTGDNKASTSPGDQGSVGDPCDFFHDQDIRLFVMSEPGGGFDTFARGLAPHLEKELGAAEVRVENVLGGGGLIGAGQLFSAEPDGLTIGLMNQPGNIYAEMSGAEGVEFQNSEWTTLGRLAAVAPLIYTAPDSEYATMEDLLNATESDPVIWGVDAVGSDGYSTAQIVSEILGTPYKLIAGFGDQSNIDAALVAGEVEATLTSLDSALITMDSLDVQPVALVATEPVDGAPDVPLIGELGDDEDQEKLSSLAAIYAVERLLVAPPGMAEDRADCMGDAIHVAATSPEYQADMEEAGRTLNVLPREEAAALAQQAGEAVELLQPHLN